MRWLINYIRSCFCKHEWEQIFFTRVKNAFSGSRWYEKVYRCKKCGIEKRYKSIE